MIEKIWTEKLISNILVNLLNLRLQVMLRLTAP